LLDHVLLSFLQKGSTNHTGEALQMEDVLVAPHHKLIGTDFEATAKAMIADVKSIKEKWITIRKTHFSMIVTKNLYCRCIFYDTEKLALGLSQ